MLKTLKTIPPGGWIFEQKTPAGTIKKFSTMVPFGEAVKGIVAYRKGNAIEPHDFESVAVELENQTCARLGHNPKYCEVKKKSLLDKINILPAHVKKAVELAGNATNGARILSDWLGDGAIPVNRSLAQARTNVCISCPLNQESHGMMKLTDAIASAILEQRRQKTEMSLEVISETELHTCSLCSCHLPLKVWVPMKTIANRTHPKLIEKFPDFCWMKTEPKETECKDGTVPTARQQSHETSEATLTSALSASARDSTIPPVASPSFEPSEPQAAPSLKSQDSPNLKSKKKTETSIPSTTV